MRPFREGTEDYSAAALGAFQTLTSKIDTAYEAIMQGELPADNN
jgi:hypothetical protein